MSFLKGVAVVFVALVLFSSCSGGDTTPTPTVTVTKETQPAPAVEQPLGDSYDMVDAMRSQDSYFLDIDAETIISTAHSFCNALDSGATLREIGEIASETIGTDHAATLGAGAIMYLCPEHKSKIS